MINFAGCIEGDRWDIQLSSDLKSRKTNGSEPSLVGGVRVPALGTLTITGSNMHRGIEMPVAQPYLFIPAILSFVLGGLTGVNAGQRSNTDEHHIVRQRFGLSRRTVGATSNWGGIRMGIASLDTPALKRGCILVPSTIFWGRGLLVCKCKRRLQRLGG
jgi:hypothetical protein